jgi:hypothetical protein
MIAAPRISMTTQVGGSPRVFGPGLWPGPRRQARWVGRGLRRSRVSPEDRFCEAVRNDLRVPLTLEGPTRTRRGLPALWLSPFIWRLAHLARDDRPGQLDGVVDQRCEFGFRLLLRSTDAPDPVQHLRWGHSGNPLRHAWAVGWRLVLPIRLPLLGSRA